MTPNRFVEGVFAGDVYVMGAYCWSRWWTRLFFFLARCVYNSATDFFIVLSSIQLAHIVFVWAA